MWAAQNYTDFGPITVKIFLQQWNDLKAKYFEQIAERLNAQEIRVSNPMVSIVKQFDSSIYLIHEIRDVNRLYKTALAYVASHYLCIGHHFFEAEPPSQRSIEERNRTVCGVHCPQD